MIIDANTWIGHWPFRRLRLADAAGLGRLLDRTGTGLALVSPLSGPFYRDCLTAVEEMLEDGSWDAARFRPVAVVNPHFPGWEEDLRTMATSMGCVALRLIPNYHDYSLHSDEAVQAATVATDLGLPVIVTARMYDERSHHPRMYVPPVPMEEVRYLMRMVPEARYLLSQVTFPEASSLLSEMDLVADAGWEMSYKPPAFMVERVVSELGGERLFYGSGAVLQYPESLLLPVQQAPIDDAARQAILGGNARRLFELGD